MLNIFKNFLPLPIIIALTLNSSFAQTAEEITTEISKEKDNSAQILNSAALDDRKIDDHPRNNSNKTNNSKDITNEYSPSNLEFITLKYQNEIIKEYHSSLLSTVYWSLSALITVAVLLVGFGWWSNFRMHEKDKERLKEEIHGMISEVKSNTDKELAENQNEILKLLDERLQKQVDRLSEELSEIKFDLNERSKEAKEKSKKFDEFISSTKSEISNLNFEISTSEFNLRIVEEIVWDIRGVPDNVILTQSQGINAAARANNPFGVNLILKRMKETLEKFANKENKRLSEYVKKQAKESLKKAEPYHPIDTGKVYEILDSIKTEETESA